MATTAAGSILGGLVGVGLLWAGLRWLGAGWLPTGLPVKPLAALGGLAAWVAGQWLCWRALARHVRPPPSATDVVDAACATLLGALALTAAIVSIYQAIS